MSGLSRTPGKRVRVNSPPRVRIPLSPPIPCFTGYFFASSAKSIAQTNIISAGPAHFVRTDLPEPTLQLLPGR